VAHLLLIEDEPRIAASIQRGLSAEQHQVEVRHDGLAGLAVARSGRFDLMIVDWMLPEMSGVELCRTLRREGNHTPVLMLTARDDTADVVQGLEAGADDYLVKPFAFQELVARARALLRRPPTRSPETLAVRGLTMDLDGRRVRWGDHEIDLTLREYQLAEALLRRPGLVLQRETLIALLWADQEEPSSNALEVHVSGLRRKLAAAGAPNGLIRTLRGVGYGVDP